jgi:hypothetical protein
MAHLVADDAADCPVVDRFVCVEIEKRWLQDRGWKHDLVAYRVVVRVHRLRRHAPFFRVNGLANFAELIFALGDRRACDVTHKIVLDDLDA